MLKAPLIKVYSGHDMPAGAGERGKNARVWNRGRTLGGCNASRERQHVWPVGVGCHDAPGHLDGRQDLGQHAAHKVADQAVAVLDVGHVRLYLLHRLQAKAAWWHWGEFESCPRKSLSHCLLS